MIRIDAIATRTGDTGTTGLADGTRVAKDHPLIEALGAVDEANSLLGVVRGEALPPAIAAALATVQNDCFDLGGDLATPPGGPWEAKIPRITTAQVARLDGWLAESAARLPPLTSFVLPAGSPGARWFHLARTVVRRAERALVAAQHRDPDRAWNPECLRYLNRLSDLCFAWARCCNDDGRADVAWVPGANRG
jgi:cob(I)alamin adenosyltransferase